jgi:ribonuclease HI
MKLDKLFVYGDSELILKQIKQIYKVRDEKLKPLYKEALSLAQQIPNITFTHIPREKNKRADELSNIAMDERRGINT